MRALAVILILESAALAQGLSLSIRPDPIHIQKSPGPVVSTERTFFHVILHNTSAAGLDVLWVRLDVAGADGAVVSAQYSGRSLTRLFDGSVERRRIEASNPGSLTLPPDGRKALTDVWMQLPEGFLGQTLVVEAEFRAGVRTETATISVPLRRSDPVTVRLPFDGTWYVSAEHGNSDNHKRYSAEAFAYDFLQIGANGKSYVSDGTRNPDYFAYGRKVLVARDGQVTSTRNDIADNTPGVRKSDVPGGNSVTIEHGPGVYSYYSHLKMGSIVVKPGDRVRAGDVIGEVGNSGDSAEPHLHFHVMNAKSPAEADGVPVQFESWKSVSYGNRPAERKGGIILKGDFVQP